MAKLKVGSSEFIGIEKKGESIWLGDGTHINLTTDILECETRPALKLTKDGTPRYIKTKYVTKVKFEAALLAKDFRFTTSDTTNTTDWGDGTIDTLSSHKYDSNGTYTITTNKILNGKFLDTNGIVEVIKMDTFDSSFTDFSSFLTSANKMTYCCDFPLHLKPTSLEGAFRSCVKLTSMPYISTENCSNFYRTFLGCDLMEGQIKQLDMSSATNINSMFQNCGLLSGSIPMMNLANVQTAVSAFSWCGWLTGVIPPFMLSSCMDSSYMFMDCVGLSGPVPDLNIPSGANTTDMFLGCTGIN